MFPAGLQARARAVAEMIVVPLALAGITPNMVTFAGFLFNAVTAIVIAAGHLHLGGILLLLSGGFDMLDGALARVSRLQSAFGAFLDSFLDRYSESAILLALLYYFAERQALPAIVLVFAVAVGSLLISYARARAESLGIECRVGIAPRPERIILLGLGLLFSQGTLLGALVILAILTHVTALQRLYHVWRQSVPPGGLADSRPGAEG
ncbi:MAG TPA: CDP-alcohol phosphatidyltransferase family protein [Chloroflexota bacterium]|nr:CDP-alcohol phosphatidyltransferase family protein [Chloroflexota bacterium]